MKNKLNNINLKKSFTLVEVLTVLALISIVGTIIVSLFVTSSNMFGLITFNIEAKMKADSVMKTLISQVRFCTELEISDDENLLYINTEKRKIYNKDGKIFIKTDEGDKDLFSDDFYGKYTISIKAKKIENNLLHLTCSVVMKGDESVKSEITTAVEAYNTQAISGLEGGILSYYWDMPN